MARLQRRCHVDVLRVLHVQVADRKQVRVVGRVAGGPHPPQQVLVVLRPRHRHDNRAWTPSRVRTMTVPSKAAERVAVLHGSQPSVAVRELVRAAQGSYRLLFVVEATGEVSSAETNLLARLGEVVVAPTSAWPEEVGRARVRGVTTFDDRYVEDLEQVARACGLPGSSRLAHPWDKYVQRRALNAAGASSAEVRLLSGTAIELAAEIGLPAVVKPLRGSTSRGVAIVNTIAELERARRAHPGDLLLEQLMDVDEGSARPGYAPFVSVETASDATRRVHFAVTDKLELVDGYLETGHVTPSRLPEPTVRSVVATVDRALDALGVSARVTHTEVRLTSSGPQVIEVNGRLGGFVQGLVRRSAALDAAALALRVATGGCVADIASYDDAPQRAPSAVVLVPLRHASDEQARALLVQLRDHPDVAAVGLPAPVDDGFRSVGAWTRPGTDVAVAAMVDAVVTQVAASPLAHLIDAAWLASCRLGR